MAKSKKVTARKTVKTAKTKAKKVKKVLPIPKGYHAITPYLIVTGGKKAIEFYKKAFGAKGASTIERDGKIAHAEFVIGDSKVMLSDGCPEKNTRSPKEFGGSPVTMHLYVKNVDAVVKRAVLAGAKLIMPVTDQFYGDRCGMVEDPFGHHWYVATHVKDLSLAKIRKLAMGV